MPPPTGEREGARKRLDGLKVWPDPEWYVNSIAGMDRPYRDRAMREALTEYATNALASLEKQSPAAPAQPGEGEVWNALDDVVAEVLAVCGDHYESVTRARALLERRGGKGLSGKGGGA